MTAVTDIQTLDAFLEAVRTRNARVGVIGLGYVGLPLVLLFEQEGFPVIGFDLDASKVATLMDSRFAAATSFRRFTSSRSFASVDNTLLLARSAITSLPRRRRLRCCRRQIRRSHRRHQNRRRIRRHPNHLRRRGLRHPCC